MDALDQEDLLDPMHPREERGAADKLYGVCAGSYLRLTDSCTTLKAPRRARAAVAKWARI